MSDKSRIFSPWRSLHLDSFLSRHGHDSDDEVGSIFSHIAAGDDDDANLILWRGETVFVVMNLYPYNNGHVLIVPYREVARYTDLTDEERSEIASTIDLVIRWIDVALEPEGYNVGINDGPAAGAGVPQHIHVHVVPRWSADTNFMPTTADTKVVPQAIRESYQRILSASRSQPLRPQRG